jgi:hypothetical protein
VAIRGTTETLCRDRRGDQVTPVKRFLADDVWCYHCKKRACPSGGEIKTFARHLLPTLRPELPVNIALAGAVYDIVRCKHCKKLNWLAENVEQEQVGTRAHPGPHVCPCGCGTMVFPEAKRVREKSKR